jgi:hypothetical protein
VVPGSSGSSNRPDFVVSQFHGDNIAMSWFLVVKEGVTPPGKTNTANARLASPHLTSTASATVIINALLWLVCIVRAAD